jgi:serine/threonine-protein kinase
MVLAGNLVASRYQLDEPIGTGWFSEVWRATDSALSRPVAVKLLHPAYAQQPEVLARFRAEARHAAALRHENIAHVYDYGESDEGPQPYLVMELVDGPSLAGVLVGGPLEAARTMDIIAQTAAGLQAAHATGLVHRDIKPVNLLLASSGTVKITDWGVSHAIGSVPAAVTGIVTGTVEYLAPERIAGAQAAPASDLYALGVVAYECLAGAPPFVGEAPDVACAHRDHPVPPLSGSVPADVSAMVMQLVAKDPSGRPGSAAEVAQQAGRLRHDRRDDLSVGAGRTPYPLAAAAVVPPPRPAMPSEAVADDVQGQVRAAPQPPLRVRTRARRLRRRSVLVLASVTIAVLIGTMLAVTVGVASVRNLAAAPPSAQPRPSTSGTVLSPPTGHPSSASPHRSARPGDTGTVPVVVSNHRITTGSVVGQERSRPPRYGGDVGQSQSHRHGFGYGYDHGHGYGQGNGNGNDQGNGNGHGQGNGNGNDQGNGNGHGQGNGNGNDQGDGNGHGQGNGNGNDQGDGNGHGQGNGNGGGQGNGNGGGQGNGNGGGQGNGGGGGNGNGNGNAQVLTISS